MHQRYPRTGMTKFSRLTHGETSLGIEESMMGKLGELAEGPSQSGHAEGKWLPCQNPGPLAYILTAFDVRL